MRRRDFIRTTGMGAAFVWGAPLFSVATPVSEKTKVVVVRGRQYPAMFDRGLYELGGLSAFIHKGAMIVLKPDISCDALPDEGLTTHPQLVKHITKQCYKSKGRAVYVFDYCFDEWTKCYKNSGIERAAKDVGAKVLPGNHELFFSEREIPGASVLTHTHLHNAFTPSCLLIDVPVLKKDPQTMIFGGLKNLTGCVCNQDLFGQHGADRRIAELLYYKKPTLTVMDAGHLLSPVPGEQAEKVLIISTDVLAADAVACRLLGIDPFSVEHLRIASELGLGTLSEDEIEIKKITAYN